MIADTARSSLAGAYTQRELGSLNASVMGNMRTPTKELGIVNTASHMA